MGWTDRGKRLILGRALRSDREVESEVPRWRALSAFGSDALSSNVYATQEIFMVLALGGAAMLAYGPWVALAVAIVFVIVVAAYRYVVMEYPSGGGDYEVAQANIGPRTAALAAAAMLIDFALTLAVSVSAVAANLVSIFPDLVGLRVPIAVAGILILALVSLRGVGDSNPALATGTYLFIAAVVVTTMVAAIRLALGDDIRAESADWEIASEGSLSGIALVLLLTRAFSSGSIAITGVESIGTAVPKMPKPRGRNAAAVLVVLGVTSMALFACLTWLAVVTDVRVTEDDAILVGIPPGETQKTLVVQVAEAVYGSWIIPVLAVVAATVLILVAAAVSSFRSFSVLGSLLARDGYLPRQLHTRGDRLVYSNGILLLSGVAILTVIIFGASVPALIQLYIIGVFLALTIGQTGMVRHWGAVLARPGTAAQRSAAHRARLLAVIGQVLTGAVLITAVISKFTRGAWLVLLGIAVLYWMMHSIRRHYAQVAADLAAEDENTATTLPSRVTALILVAKIHKPTLRAISYARATRPTTIEAITVAVDGREALALSREWERRDIPIPLIILDSPYREINRPVLDYVAGLQKESPRDLVTIYVPEYLVGHWWERFLHNQTAARLKRRLMTFRNVTVVSVPWQIRSSQVDHNDSPL